MNIKILITTLISVLSLTSISPFAADGPDLSATAAWKNETRVVGYLMNWRGNPSQDRVDALTHIYLTGYRLDTLKLDGTLDTTKHNNSEQVNELVAMGQTGNTKIMIMVGGWGSHKGFAEAAATEEARQKFADDLVSYLTAHGLAGADIDWEFPENQTEYANYELMVQKIHEEFTKEGLLLTSAKGQDTYDEWPVGTYQYLDWVNVMAYDMNWARAGSLMRDNHAPTGLAEDNLSNWLALGIPKEKLVFGVPFYGRQTDNWGVAETYATIYSDYLPEHSHNIAGGFNYNGPNTIYNKAAYLIENNYGGAMIWEIEQDLGLYSGNSLHRALITGIEDGLAGTAEEKAVTLDVNVNEPDETVESLVTPLHQFQYLEVSGNILTNTSSNTLNLEITLANGQIISSQELRSGESMELPQLKHSLYVRELNQ